MRQFSPWPDIFKFLREESLNSGYNCFDFMVSYDVAYHTAMIEYFQSWNCVNSSAVSKVSVCVVSDDIDSSETYFSVQYIS